jgi:hypothetical protein
MQTIQLLQAVRTVVPAFTSSSVPLPAQMLYL